MRWKTAMALLTIIVISTTVFIAVHFPGKPEASTPKPKDTGNTTTPIWQERPGRKAVIPSGTQLPSLANLVKELKPAVVNIYTTQVVRPQTRSLPHGQQQRNPLFDFFFDGNDPFGRMFDMPGREMKRNSLGTGFIISRDGYVLTNHHVVGQATEIKVKLVDDREFSAELVGSDPRTDVALLKLEEKAGRNLPVTFLGDSDRMEAGDWVLAIGNPFGLGHTVTSGIISAKARQIGHGPYDDFLQTDAAINPGNSGGPLFDTAGNVVGINTAIVARGSGIGFAVPINLVKQLLPQLRDKGKVSRGWLGVGIQDLTPELANTFGVKDSAGVLVAQVFEKSPAEKAKIQAGDIITHIDRRPMTNSRILTQAVGSLSPGRRVAVRLLREGKPLTIHVELDERDAQETTASAPKPSAPAPALLGLTLEAVTPPNARRLGLDGSVSGLLVTGVDEDSPANGILRPRDVILEVNRQPVATREAFTSALERNRTLVLMRIQRGNARIFVTFTR